MILSDAEKKRWTFVDEAMDHFLANSQLGPLEYV